MTRRRRPKVCIVETRKVECVYSGVFAYATNEMKCNSSIPPAQNGAGKTIVLISTFEMFVATLSRIRLHQDYSKRRQKNLEEK